MDDETLSLMNMMNNLATHVAELYKRTDMLAQKINADTNELNEAFKQIGDDKSHSMKTLEYLTQRIERLELLLSKDLEREMNAPVKMEKRKMYN